MNERNLRNVNIMAVCCLPSSIFALFSTFPQFPRGVCGILQKEGTHSVLKG